MINLHQYGNPTKFMKIILVIRPFLNVGTIALLGVGVWLSFWGSPQDYQQGNYVRIMYVHVPASWLALSFYGLVALSNAAGLIWRYPMAFLAAKSLAPVGMCFTLVSLITGSIWGKPMWGTWWVWDARLTSMAVLGFLYLGYWILTTAFENEERGLHSGAILTLVGSINLPIIKWSVDWWNTLHQPASIFKKSGPAIAPEMLWPLGTMALGALGVGLIIFCIRIELEIIQRKAHDQRTSS